MVSRPYSDLGSPYNWLPRSWVDLRIAGARCWVINHRTRIRTQRAVKWTRLLGQVGSFAKVESGELIMLPDSKGY